MPLLRSDGRRRVTDTGAAGVVGDRLHVARPSSSAAASRRCVDVAPTRKLCEPVTYDAAPMNVRSSEK